MNPTYPDPSTHSSITPPKDEAQQGGVRSGPPAGPPAPRRNYFELRLRIRYWWLWTALGVVSVVYPIAVMYTAFSMRYFAETTGTAPVYQQQWEATGCPDRLKKLAEAHPLGDWGAKHRWQHLLKLDDSYLAQSNQEILNEPYCLGARIGHLLHKPGPWRYDIVDAQRQTILVTVTPGK